MSLNAVEFYDGQPVLTPVERNVYSQIGVSLDYTSGNGYPGQGHHYYSPKGTLLLTTRRIIYVPTPAQQSFTSLSIPMAHLLNGKLVQPWFGANKFTGDVAPVFNGGLTLPGVVVLTFNEGGAFEFSTAFKVQVDRRVEEEQEEVLPAYQ